MRISDWSSDVCSSDLRPRQSIGAMSCLRLGGGLDGLQASVQFGESLRCTDIGPQAAVMLGTDESVARCGPQQRYQRKSAVRLSIEQTRSEEHTSELQSLMSISYDVFWLKTNNKTHIKN